MLENSTICFLTLVYIVIFLIYLYIKQRIQYWKNKNVPYLKPKFPFGNFENPLRRKHQLGILTSNFYKHFKAAGSDHFGLFYCLRPLYVPVNPEHVKSVLSTGFSHFMDRGFYYNEKDDPLTAHLFNLAGQKWKNLRAKLTPTFSSGKIKMMFPNIVTCANPMLEYIDQQTEKKHILEVKEILSSYTTDVIGSCAFGIDCNSFQNIDSEFARHGSYFFKMSRNLRLKYFFTSSFPKLSKTLALKLLPEDLTNFFVNLVRDNIEYREKNNKKRQDFIQLLMELKDKFGTKIKMTIEEMTAQAFVFFLAGYETSATTMTFALLELSLNQNIQNKVRQELEEVLKEHDGQLSYDSVLGLQYLNQVVEETLRKYPPGSLVPRVCTKDYKMPGTDVVIEEGSLVFIPIYGLHHDPEHFPNPDIFDPERFNAENRKKITPFTYLPFGEGPRICIGLRFGMIESLVGLALILSKFKVTFNAKTKYPVEFDPCSFTLSSKKGIYLNFEKLS